MPWYGIGGVVPVFLQVQRTIQRAEILALYVALCREWCRHKRRVKLSASLLVTKVRISGSIVTWAMAWMLK